MGSMENPMLLPFDEFMAKYVYPAFEYLQQDTELAAWQMREKNAFVRIIRPDGKAEDIIFNA
jgi:hypothetical protein